MNGQSAARPLPKMELGPRHQPSSEIAKLLLDHILSGGFEPGSRLPSERELAESFGTGRGPVREALKSIGLLGLTEVRQGDGTYLANRTNSILPSVVQWGLLLGEQSTLDLVETRLHIEGAIARLAAQRRSEEDLEAMAQALEVMRVTGDSAEFTEADVQFHLAVARAAKNTVMASMLENIQSLLYAWIRRVIDAAGETETSHLEHVPVYEAIRDQDGDEAFAAMSSHVAEATARLSEVFAEHHDTTDVIAKKS